LPTSLVPVYNGRIFLTLLCIFPVYTAYPGYHILISSVQYAQDLTDHVRMRICVVEEVSS